MKSVKSIVVKQNKSKKMKSFQYIIIAIVTALCTSCETDVDASDLLEQQQLIVINGYLSPQDTTLKVQISKSKSRASNGSSNTDDLIIKNATVTITDENENEAALVYSESSFSYEAPATDLAILPGQQYFLTTMVEGKEYKAACSIPLNIVQNIESEVRENTSDDFFGNRVLKVSIEDIEDQRNFYIVGAKVLQIFDGGGDSEFDVDFEFEQFTTDSNRENSVITVDGFFDLFSDAQPNPQVKIQVANAEEILYDALRATFLNDYNDGDPFFEPVIAPTNIEGENGFGVFAGYQITEKETTF